MEPPAAKAVASEAAVASELPASGAPFKSTPVCAVKLSTVHASPHTQQMLKAVPSKAAVASQLPA